MKFIPCLIALLLLSAVPAIGQGARYTVQLEASPSLETAQEKARKFRESGIEAYIVRGEVPGKGTFYRVRVGIFDSLAEAKKFGMELKARGKIADFYAASYERPQADLIGSVREDPRPAPAEPAVEKSKTPPPPIAKPATPPPVAKNTPPPPPAKAAPAVETVTERPAVKAPSAGFVRFQDTSIGFSFERPQSWEGGPLDAREIQEQKVNAGAFFKSYQDSAFINAIWNNLERANSPENDNDLIVELIVKSMSSGEGTEQMIETARKVVSENGVIKTYLDLNARFRTQGQDAPLDFFGKAVIVRAGRGILLVVTFYSKNGPPYVPAIADRIIASVQAP